MQSFFGRGVDMNHANDTRPILDAVAMLCKEYDCTPMYVRHIGKTQRAKALHAALGSIDITGNMRSVLFLGQDPDNKERRILAHTKMNNADTGPSMAYLVRTAEIEICTADGGSVPVDAPRLDWDGRSEITANDLAAPPAVDEEDTSALDQAREFLGELLKDGAMLYDEVLEAMKQSGIALKTLKRAKPLAGVKSRRRPVAETPSKDWPWEWYLIENVTGTR
jgi:hypothetical protein